MNKTIMHVNYGEVGYNSYGNHTVDDICKMAAEIGYDGIEFRSAPPKEFADMPIKDYVKQIADAKKKYNLSTIMFSISISECANPDKEAREKSIAGAIETAKLVNDMCDTTICNCFASYIACPIKTAPTGAYEFNGSFAATPEQWELTAESFRKLGDAAVDLGMKFGFETHMNYIHDLPAATMKLVNMIDSPAIGVNMDYGNTVYFPVRPTVTEAIELYGDKLFYTHLKNSRLVANTRMATALSEGEINHRDYLAKLKEVGFSGPIGIEAPRPGDRVWFAQEDFKYYKTVMATL